MAEQVAQRLEPDPATQQGHGERVPEAVDPVKRDRQTTAADPFLKDVADGGGLEDTRRGAVAQEEFATRVRNEIAKWKKVAAAAGIKPQ